MGRPRSPPPSDTWSATRSEGDRARPFSSAWRNPRAPRAPSMSSWPATAVHPHGPPCSNTSSGGASIKTAGAAGPCSRCSTSFEAMARRERSSTCARSIRYDSASDQDAVMANTLSAAMDALRPAQTLVLVGNVHSRTLEGIPVGCRGPVCFHGCTPASDTQRAHRSRHQGCRRDGLGLPLRRPQGLSRSRATRHEHQRSHTSDRAGSAAAPRERLQRLRGIPEMPSPLIYRSRLWFVRDGGMVTSYEPVGACPRAHVHGRGLERAPLIKPAYAYELDLR